MNDQPEERELAENGSDITGSGTAQDHLHTLRSLTVPAPANTFLRFRRRATLSQGTRMLFESQVIGFWVVLNAFLRLLLGSGHSAKPRTAQGDRT